TFHFILIYICLVLVTLLTNGLSVMIRSLCPHRFQLVFVNPALTHVTFSQTRMFYFVPKLMSWSDAQMHCRQNYIDLATIDDQADGDEMMRVIRQFYNGDVWTGLSRTDENASWVWSDQSPSTFMPWAPTQPNNWEGKQFCVLVTPAADLNDVNCTITLPSVFHIRACTVYGKHSDTGET
uniref:C-type lectin domain-containing protein n=1 Tax=Cyprinus carpio TaxID=7962 RepID=A0A8C1RBP6_CYPCA